MSLTEKDIKLGHCYSAKRPRASGIQRYLNDRYVISIRQRRNKTMVMYNTPTTVKGHPYPEVTIDKFLEWAKEDVTMLLPVFGTIWRTRE